MNNPFPARALRLCACAFAALLSCSVLAQTYPTKPVRLIVPFPPGSGVDVLSRIVAPALAERLGQQVFADNRGGASGTIGAELAVRAPADGYTLLMATASMLTVTPHLRKVGYDAERDFTYVVQLASTPSVLVVHPTMPVRTLKQLVALAKARPGVITFASTGNGTPPHLAGEFLKIMAGVDLLHVPFNGSGPAMTNLLGGQVDMFFVNMQSATPMMRSGKVRPIVVTSQKRHEAAPDVPTVLESGYPEFNAGNTWYGLLAPAGMRPEITDRIYAESMKVLQVPEIQEQLRRVGATIVGANAQQFAATVRAESARWQKVLKAAGIKAE
jgi:tripartite-type tricarboxylate transporter receptor subunit TctC